MTSNFRKATTPEIPQIWGILQQAIARRKEDGYPNPEVIQSDIAKNTGFVLTKDDTIIGYTAVLINDEPA
jgi:hypothetical protein